MALYSLPIINLSINYSYVIVMIDRHKNSVQSLNQCSGISKPWAHTMGHRTEIKQNSDSCQHLEVYVPVHVALCISIFAIPTSSIHHVLVNSPYILGMCVGKTGTSFYPIHTPTHPPTHPSTHHLPTHPTQDLK